MALINCKQCGGQVSYDAKACPHCGSKAFNTAGMIAQFGQGLIGCGCLLMILSVVVVVIIIALGGAGGKKQGVKPKATPTTLSPTRPNG